MKNLAARPRNDVQNYNFSHRIPNISQKVLLLEYSSNLAPLFKTNMLILTLSVKSALPIQI